MHFSCCPVHTERITRPSSSLDVHQRAFSLPPPPRGIPVSVSSFPTFSSSAEPPPREPASAVTTLQASSCPPLRSSRASPLPSLPRSSFSSSAIPHRDSRSPSFRLDPLVLADVLVILGPRGSRSFVIERRTERSRMRPRDIGRVIGEASFVLKRSTATGERARSSSDGISFG